MRFQKKLIFGKEKIIKPKLRRSLLKDYTSPISFNKKINKIILKIA